MSIGFDPGYQDYVGGYYGTGPSVPGGGGGGGLFSGAASGAAAGTSIAPGIGTLIGGAVGLVGGLFGHHAARRAARRQAEAERQRLEFEQRRYAQQQLYREPYLQAGRGGLAGLQMLSSPEGREQFLNQYLQGPEFARLSQAAREQQLASAEATGQLGSSFTQAGLGAIAPELGLSALAQQRQAYAQLAGIGQNTLGLQSQASQAYGGRVGQYLGNIGAAQAGGTLGGSSALLGSLQGLGLLGYGTYQQQHQTDLNRLYNRPV